MADVIRAEDFAWRCEQCGAVELTDQFEYEPLPHIDTLEICVRLRGGHKWRKGRIVWTPLEAALTSSTESLDSEPERTQASPGSSDRRGVPLDSDPEPGAGGGTTHAVEARLRRHRWVCVQPGADGLGAWQHKARGLGLIHSVALEQDGELWEHISLSRRDGAMPTWEQVRDVFHDVCGAEALGIIVVPPRSEHVNIAEVAHVWRCLTQRPLPDFTRGSGSI